MKFNQLQVHLCSPKYLMMAALLLSGCAATPPPQIVGRYSARLSHADIEQIRVVISKQSHIDHRIRKLDVLRPDKVHVETGPPNPSIGGTVWGLIVVKRAEKWFIDPNSGVEATAQKTIIAW